MEIKQIAEVEDSEVDKCEKFYIKFFKSIGMELTNATDGGDGMKNPSVETRNKMSLARIGKSPINKGVPCSAKTKIKISNAKHGKMAWNKGKPNSPEHKINQGLAKQKISLEEILKQIKNGLSHREIGRKFNLSHGTISTRLRRQK